VGVLVLVGVLVVLAFSSSALAYSLLAQERLYGAQVEYVLTPRADLSDTAVDRLSQTQLLIVTSPSVLQPVAAQLGTSLPALQGEVSAEMEGRSNIMRIIATDPDPQRALTVAGTVANEYEAVTHAQAARVAGTAPVTASLLTQARVMDQPVQPRPLRAVATGALLGLVVAALMVVALWRPGSWPRQRPEWR
jgi:capsular polysaccharide biosynthesis protein